MRCLIFAALAMLLQVLKWKWQRQRNAGDFLCRAACVLICAISVSDQHSSWCTEPSATNRKWRKTVSPAWALAFPLASWYPALCVFHFTLIFIIIAPKLAQWRQHQQWPAKCLTFENTERWKQQKTWLKQYSTNMDTLYIQKLITIDLASAGLSTFVKKFVYKVLSFFFKYSSFKIRLQRIKHFRHIHFEIY